MATLDKTRTKSQDKRETRNGLNRFNKTRSRSKNLHWRTLITSRINITSLVVLFLVLVDIIAQVRGAKTGPDGGPRVSLGPLWPALEGWQDRPGLESELDVAVEALSEGPWTINVFFSLLSNKQGFFVCFYWPTKVQSCLFL